MITLIEVIIWFKRFSIIHVLFLLVYSGASQPLFLYTLYWPCIASCKCFWCLTLCQFPKWLTGACRGLWWCYSMFIGGAPRTNPIQRGSWLNNNCFRMLVVCWSVWAMLSVSVWRLLLWQLAGSLRLLPRLVLWGWPCGSVKAPVPFE